VRGEPVFMPSVVFDRLFESGRRISRAADARQYFPNTQ